jgi:hypothetical protein
MTADRAPFVGWAPAGTGWNEARDAVLPCTTERGKLHVPSFVFKFFLPAALIAMIGTVQAQEVHQTRPGTREQFCGAMFQRCKAGVIQRTGNSYRASGSCSWRAARCTNTGVWQR